MNEFKMRQGLWKKTDDMIKEANKKADESTDTHPQRLAHNKFSDMTSEEKSRSLGNMLPPGLHKSEDEIPSLNKLSEGSEDLCKSRDCNIDWSKKGVTGPIKDYGKCAQSFAHATNTALEARVAIKTEQPYERLSE